VEKSFVQKHVEAISIRYGERLQVQADEVKEVRDLHNKKERKKDDNTPTSFVKNECKALSVAIVILYKGGSSSL
jgi:DNA repair exonuclease SbcCD nuclease subunit